MLACSPSLGSDGGKGAVASAASRAAKSKRSASSDSASSPSSSLSSSPSGGSSLGSLAAACAPLPAGALRRRAVEERQRWRRPRHLPWRRRPSPASPRAPAQHGSPSIAMRAAAKCLAGNLAGVSTQLRPVDTTTDREAGNHRRSASATPGPAGRFAVASTPPKGCSAAMGEGHHSYSLPTAAHREQDMEARRETRGAARSWAGWGISAASGPRRRDTRRVTWRKGGLSGCK